MADTLPKPDYATKNMRLVGYSDQDGRCDGVQIMVHRGYAYIGHIFSKGFSVIDVRDPAHPKYVKHVAAPPNTWTLHLQAHDDTSPGHPQQGHVRPGRARRREGLLQRLGRSSRQARSRRAQLVGRHGGLRHLQARRPQADRLHAGRGNGPASHVVCRRALGLRLRAARRLLRLYPHHHRHEGPEEAGHGREILAAGHERGGRREGELADQERAFRPPSRDHPRRHRLLQLARRLPRGRRRQGQGQSEAPRPQGLGAAVRRRHA